MRRPEMAEAVAAAALLQLGHEQEGEQEREEEHSAGKEEMGSGLKRNGASPGQLAGGDTGRAEMRALLTGRKTGGTGFQNRWHRFRPVAHNLARSAQNKRRKGSRRSRGMS